MSVHAASSNVSLLSSPSLHTRALPSSDTMSRAGSADSSQRPPLKKKQSRKELKLEMQRSASAMSATPPTPSQALPPATSYSNSKHKHSKSLEEDADNDDARSISSFTCAFAGEFDAKQRSRSSHSNEEASSRQRFLDAVFRKLTQKTGLHQRESRAWAVVDQKIQEDENRAKALQAKARKSKPHFLDLSTLISPLPCNSSPCKPSTEGLAAPSTDPGIDNVTPRPADFKRFHSSGDHSEHMASASLQKPMTPARNTLRPRRSTESLGEGRRLQKEEWMTPLILSESPIDTMGSGSLGLSVGQVIPSGMSQVMVARAAAVQHSQPPRSAGFAPVPVLPDWARDSNRSLHHHSGQRSIDMGKNAMQPVGAARAVDMGRAASHDASIFYHQRSLRGTPVQRGASGPIRGLGSPESAVQNIPPSLQLRNQRMMPTSPNWPGYNALPLEDCISPLPGMPPPHLNRISSSSTTSSSGTSSGISSVPQTPITRNIPLASVQSSLMRFEDADELHEMTADQEDNLLSGMSLYGLPVVPKSAGRFGPPPVSMTPRPGQMRQAHVASASLDSQGAAMTPMKANRPVNFSHLKSSSGSVMTTSSSSIATEDGTSTVKVNRIQNRPRANTTSSMQSPTRIASAGTDKSAVVLASPESPSRTSSLQKRRNHRSPSTTSGRDSVLSTSTTSSSSTHASESFLSYARASPTSSCHSPINEGPQISPRGSSQKSPKRSVSKAEDWASTIGRRFVRGGTPIRNNSNGDESLSSPLCNEAAYAT